jgi:hypothetical protein
MRDGEELDLRAVRAFDRQFETIRAIWKPGREDQWMFRKWAITDAGQVIVPPVDRIELPSKRAGKDASVIALALWCASTRPAGIVLASEGWGFVENEQGYRLCLRELGGTPDLMDPENRRLMAERYGMPPFETLLLYGQLRGRPPRMENYTIRGARLVRRPPGMARHLYDGILDGLPVNIGGI